MTAVIKGRKFRTNYLSLGGVILFLIFNAFGCNEEKADAYDWPTLEYDSSQAIYGSLDTPRDIVFDPSGGPGCSDVFFYVCNRGDNGGVGFVSRIPGQSTIPSETAWVGHLTSPAGIALTGNHQLLIAAGAEVIVIDTTRGEETNRIAVSGASQLNDIVVNSETGRFYVSDTIAGKIFTGRYWETTTSVFRTMEGYENIGALALSEDDGLLFIGCYQHILYVDLENDSDVEEYLTLTDFEVNGITFYGHFFIVCDSAKGLLLAVDDSGNAGRLLEVNTGYSPGDVLAVENEYEGIWYLYVPTLAGNMVNVYQFVI